MLDSYLHHVQVYGRMIKFSHTIFALPFALSAVVLAQRREPLQWDTLLWIVVAMVGARSAAMGFNRIVDAGFDACNPRTRRREIPSGRLSIGAAWIFVLGSAAVFMLSAAMLGSFCFYLAGPVLVLLFFYSYTKRFTWFSHLYLGFAISLAPLGAWIAVTGSVSWPVLMLCVALWTYIAGFDILYACQDMACDQQLGLCSIPARYGAKRAFKIAAALHWMAFSTFMMMPVAFGMHPVFLVTVGVIGLLLWIEHRLVRPDDLSRMHVAFFHVNSLISLILLIGVLADEWLRRWH